MKLSIVIPVLNSHEIVRRQLLHFSQMPLPDDVELILVDDGSDPPLAATIPTTAGVRIIATGDTRPWTQPKARNIGAREARGENLLFTDIDHIVTSVAIAFGRTMAYDYARFRREFGVLDEQGVFSQDREMLEQYGVSRARGLHVACHTLSMIVKASVFHEIGGFREKLGSYPTHDDGNMKRSLIRGQYTKCPDDERPKIYVIPNGRFCDVKGCQADTMFHTLVRQ